MRRTLLAAPLLLGCRGKNDLGVPKGCPTQFDDPDPVIREGIRRRLNELDLPPEERPKYRWPNRTAFAWPGDDPPLWDPWFNINTTAWSDWLDGKNKTFLSETKDAMKDGEFCHWENGTCSVNPGVKSRIKADFEVLKKARINVPSSNTPTACRFRTKEIAGTHYDVIYNIEDFTWRVKLFKPLFKHPARVYAFDGLPYWEIDGRWEHDRSFSNDRPDEFIHISKWSLDPCVNCVPQKDWPENRKKP